MMPPISSESNLPGCLGGTELPTHLHQLKDGEWRVRVAVPPAVRHILKKATRTRRLETKDKGEAEKLAARWIGKFQAEIAEAERQLPGYIGPHYTFYGGSGNSFGSGVRIRRGRPSANMIPVVHEGLVGGWRLREPGDSNAGIEFDSLLALWISEGHSASVKARRAVKGMMKRLCEFLGHTDAARVSADDLASYPAALLASGLKLNTVDDHIVYLRRLFALAKEAEWIAANPAEHLRRA
jgi:hypothetical protein